MIESLQGRLIFGRTTRIRLLQPGPHAGASLTTACRLARPDGAVLEGWSASPIAGPIEGTLLYFGGRNENVAWVAGMASFNPGWVIHAFNYRGFGTSTGRVSERRAKSDARAIHDAVAAPGTLAIAGRSLGTAIALALARETRPARLVLMSPFDSVPDVLRTRPFARALAGLVTQRFACADLAAAHGGATLVLLADRDTSIPHERSRALCARLPRAPTVHVVDGTTHQSLPRSPAAQSRIAAFLASAPGHLPSTFIPRSS
jgi:pimeloyl-ACP methyl ester carboxylesterase